MISEPTASPAGNIAFLRPHELKAMCQFKSAVAAGERWGTRKNVSMQRLEDRGLVKAEYRNGMIANFVLTEAGIAWSPSTNRVPNA